MVSTITSGIHRLGDEIVNSYLVSDAGEVTIIDAGAPGYWKLVPAALATLGVSPTSVRAIVLTHGHTDHIGFAERGRRERGWPVLVHKLDAALARGEVPNPAKGIGSYRLAPLLGFLLWTARHGGLRITHLGEVGTFGDGARLDLPGAPRVIHVPGHTPGSAVLHLIHRSALLVGDAIATYSVTTGVNGPRVAPFTADAPKAIDSLKPLEGLDARYVLPGHGGAWDQGIDAAIQQVRQGLAAQAG